MCNQITFGINHIFTMHLVLLGGFRIYKKEPNSILEKLKIKERPFPKELDNILLIHIKTVDWFDRILGDDLVKQKISWSTRQEEDSAKQTVCQTASTAAQSAKYAGQIGTGTVRLVRRIPKNIRQEAVDNVVSAPYYASEAKQFDGYEITLSTSDFAPDRSTPETRGRELARSRAKQRTDRLREQRTIARIKDSDLRSGTGLQREHLPQPGTAPHNPAIKPRKLPAPRLREVPAQAGKTAHTASVATQRALQLAVRNKQAAKAAARGIRAIVQKLVALFKATTAAVKSIAAALTAGGTAAVLVVVFICLIAMVAGSSFGIFFAAQPAGNGIALQSAVQQLTDDYYAQIREIEESIPHDRLEYAPDGLTAIRWEDVLSVFAADMAAAENGQPVAVLETAQIDRLKEILWQMNPVTYRTYTEQHEEERTTIDDEDNEITKTVTVTETVLEITVLHSTPQDTASVLGFTIRQNEQLGLLVNPQYTSLWMELLGGYVSGGGQILTPETGPSGTGIFQWPLPDTYPITSGFGGRTDPITGESDFHSGTDIAAPAGTPILAAADGTVTIANGTDSWGGSYGYYIKINHDATYVTLYAHCSAICVTAGQTVRQGEVIGYVGSTGNSTGNHLHFEVWVNRARVDAMSGFSL